MQNLAVYIWLQICQMLTISYNFCIFVPHAFIVNLPTPEMRALPGKYKKKQLFDSCNRNNMGDVISKTYFKEVVKSHQS